MKQHLIIFFLCATILHIPLQAGKKPTPEDRIKQEINDLKPSNELEEQIVRTLLAFYDLHKAMLAGKKYEKDKKQLENNVEAQCAALRNNLFPTKKVLDQAKATEEEKSLDPKATEEEKSLATKEYEKAAEEYEKALADIQQVKNTPKYINTMYEMYNLLISTWDQKKIWRGGPTLEWFAYYRRLLQDMAFILGQK